MFGKGRIGGGGQKYSSASGGHHHNNNPIAGKNSFSNGGRKNSLSGGGRNSLSGGGRNSLSGGGNPFTAGCHGNRNKGPGSTSYKKDDKDNSKHPADQDCPHKNTTDAVDKLGPSSTDDKLDAVGKRVLEAGDNFHPGFDGPTSIPGLLDVLKAIPAPPKHKPTGPFP